MFKKIRTFFPVLFLGILLSSCLHNHGIAQAPPADLKFPENKNVVEIPFTRFRGWIIIKVSVNDSKDLSFIFDSGAPIAGLIDTSCKDQLNLNVMGNVMVGGSDPNKPRSMPLAGQVKFKIGDIIIENGLMGLGMGSEIIDGVDGIIGKYIFDDAVVTVNWKENKLILTRPSAFKYNGTGEVIPIKLLSSGHLSTDISVEKNGKKISFASDIDLGNRSNFHVDKEKAASLSENQKIIPDIIVAWGANGPARGDVLRTNVQIGSFILKDVITALETSNSIIKKDGLNANIGLSILERFTPTFDLPHHQLILEKRENFSSPFTFNRSGIIIHPKQQGNAVVVADIIPSSPAQENGLQKDDRIFSINGKKITDLTPDMIDDIIKGKNIESLDIVLMRSGKEIHATLKIRDLV